MATSQDAELIIKLYDLRREKKLRKARAFVIGQFFPQSIDDIKALFLDRKHPEYNAYFRQAMTYWDMAAALVNHGTLDRDLFFETNGELFAIWSKVDEHITGIREILGPNFMLNAEKLVASYPNAEERVQAIKQRLKNLAAARATQNKD